MLPASLLLTLSAASVVASIGTFFTAPPPPKPEKLVTAHRRSLREVFVIFLRFSRVFESVWTRSDVLGRVRMRSDTRRCVWRRLDTSGNLMVFRVIFVIFSFFWTLGVNYFRLRR